MKKCSWGELSLPASVGGNKEIGPKTRFANTNERVFHSTAAIAQLGERQAEDLKVPVRSRVSTL